MNIEWWDALLGFILAYALMYWLIILPPKTKRKNKP